MTTRPPVQASALATDQGVGLAFAIRGTSTMRFQVSGAHEVADAELGAWLSGVQELLERVPAPLRWVAYFYVTSVLAELLGAPQVAAEIRTLLVRLLGG